MSWSPSEFKSGWSFFGGKRGVVSPPDESQPIVAASDDPWDVKTDVFPTRAPLPVLAQKCYLCDYRRDLYLTPGGVTICERCGDNLEWDRRKANGEL